jgi:hypothetical protein
MPHLDASALKEQICQLQFFLGMPLALVLPSSTKPNELATAPTSPKWWLVFANGAGIGQHLATRLDRQGAQYVVVARSESYTRIAPNRYTINPLDAASFRRLLTEVYASQFMRRCCVFVEYRYDTDRRNYPPIAARRMSAHNRCVLHLVQALTQVGWSEPATSAAGSTACTNGCGR